MLINEIITNKLSEGPNDPHIFKAIFLAGGPGSGKSFVAQELLTGFGLKSVNSDEIYEYLANKQNVDLSDPVQVASPQGQGIRDRAKELTGMRNSHYTDGRLGLIIDGTGKDVAKIKQTSTNLKALGYDTMMVFVNSSIEVAQQRNTQRKRQLPVEMVTMMWKQVQDNMMKLQQVFGAVNFHIVDNSGGQEDPDRKENFAEIYKDIRNFVNTVPSAPQARKWLADQSRSDK